MSTGQTARALQALDASRFEFVKVENTVKDMLDAGSRYNNLEKALGEGVLFVLGKGLSESLWTKLLPKSGKTFDAAISHLKAVGLSARSRMYAQLRKTVVEAKVALVLSLPQAYPSYESVSTPVLEWGVAFPQANYPQAQCFCAGPEHCCGL
ncbi:hypothetical protein PV05_02576 [Exophiala xenobiotica]|uniref:Uncharacterized protein n=1 Tax=Exophiala xenobiotica TaxID=348802 RepID=A0A0D2FDB3_9EURO|nr:uncharacterized protein PV05_02576 [Exophiala xenobiotica]KIW58024.1 hypothetical protein PV05_02576 [Exophiala xenobiotica]